eukprot:TRINITY_DN1205_c0_g1_i4.p1 TRINITY_DN1205_c0_g1~~TRINITY_DN1205_c0_g1_i4.p1  ORF type:complete len:104 (-),score=7.46 TRINITY_DN1205_c0_g1_i4:1187-1498(-)
MTALLFWKLLLPFILVSSVYLLINRRNHVAEGKSFLIVTAFSDLLSMHFFFLVNDNGSWKDIGMSISHFAIANLFIVFILVMLAISKVVVRGVQTDVARKRKL